MKKNVIIARWSLCKINCYHVKILSLNTHNVTQRVLSYSRISLVIFTYNTLSYELTIKCHHLLKE